MDSETPTPKHANFFFPPTFFFLSAPLAMSSSHLIDISKLNKVDLLHALWRASKLAIFYSTDVAVNAGIKAPDFDLVAAEQAVREGHIDYFQGRAIKMDLSKDTTDPSCFDRDYGVGAASRVIATFEQAK